MASEDPFVKEALNAAKEVLEKPLSIEQKASLLYQVTVDNLLNVTVDPKSPKRGQSAFQTDLCVFEEVKKGVKIPRVVMEFKTGLSTHDVLTYSSKARKHKNIYPYLRYGIITANHKTVPGRFFTHNESLDFCVAVLNFKKNSLHEIFSTLLSQEVAASRQLEQITYGKIDGYLYRNNPVILTQTGKVK